MNRNEFTEELKALTSSMSEAEIEKTIQALKECRAAVYQKQSQDKSEKARLYTVAEPHRSQLRYRGMRGADGVISVLGASLLTIFDFERLREEIPRVCDSWWLFEKQPVINGVRYWWKNKSVICGIRPVLIIDEIHGDLLPGDSFFVSEEQFDLLSPSLAIRAVCLEEPCAYTAANYGSSVIRLCIDGWYARLIGKSETAAASAN